MHLSQQGSPNKHLVPSHLFLHSMPQLGQPHTQGTSLLHPWVRISTKTMKNSLIKVFRDGISISSDNQAIFSIYFHKLFNSQILRFVFIINININFE